SPPAPGAATARRNSGCNECLRPGTDMKEPMPLDCAAVEEQDLIPLYVAGRLEPQQAEAFERHYFGCERCWEDLQTATAVKAGGGRTVNRRSALLWAYAAAATIAIAFLIPLAMRRGSLQGRAGALVSELVQN